jgi:hypothetical protein
MKFLKKILYRVIPCAIISGSGVTIFISNHYNNFLPHALINIFGWALLWISHEWWAYRTGKEKV